MDPTKVQNIKTLMSMLKVLIVEDEPYSRKVVKTLLTAIGVTKIYEAKDGASGLEAIEANHPDIVLLDWEMPGMNGTEFMRRVRSPATFTHPAVPSPITDDPDLRRLMRKLMDPKVPDAEKKLFRRLMRSWIGEYDEE